MKSFFSSTTMVIFIFFFLFFFTSTNSIVQTHSLPPTNPSRNTHNNLPYCDSFSRKNPRSLCIELQKLHHKLHSAVPPSKEIGIDTRYGAEKRLVPSGPNPLHN
ncbi:hypothetical protein Lal_00025589 [Lupinus albus]|uniref:Uncharacterized protein n=1 Tax=Lupinus albus TaxID=3870 RepID=A0A6A5NZ82_LUPAL|nr:hypothetical protein Lalb_Chr10g0098651 [Lupinus albus]KAF1890256.1 hypothetical protein Lal_00025589 [Lupinus albus]